MIELQLLVFLLFTLLFLPGLLFEFYRHMFQVVKERDIVSP
jgi:hypothetical protein